MLEQQIKKMPKKDDEKRNINRIELPQASVQYKISSAKLNTFKNYSVPQKLINISKSGLSFDLIEEVSYGDPVDLKVFFSDGNKMHLKGKVRWTKIGDGYAVKTVGVLFNAFGSQKKYNSIEALQYLRTLKEQAVEKMDNSDQQDLD